MEEKNKIISIKKFTKGKITKGKIQKREVVVLIIIMMVITLFISGYSMGKGVSETKVKNYNTNDEITQIDLLYTVEILTKTDESITFKLYKNEKEVPLENNKSQEMLLTKNEKKEDKYKLEILYNEEKAQSRDIFQDIQIKVHSEQRKV